jgi:hypothetical protein
MLNCFLLLFFHQTIFFAIIVAGTGTLVAGPGTGARAKTGISSASGTGTA